jgi:NACalpha-BTF3-like transcription factor
MGNILSKLTSLIDNIDNYSFTNKKIRDQLLLLCKEYLSILNKYESLTEGIIFNIIHKFHDTLIDSLDIINTNINDKMKVFNIINGINEIYDNDVNIINYETKLQLYNKFTNYDTDIVNTDTNDINTQLNNMKLNDTQLNEIIDVKLNELLEEKKKELDKYEDLEKEFSNALLSQLSKIQKQELIIDGVDIIMKQIPVNKEQATRLIVENRYDPANAILSFMNCDKNKLVKTHLTFQANQHELVNNLILISDKISTVIITEITDHIKSNYNSFTCIIINNDNDIRKRTRYASIIDLYNSFISSNNNNFTLIHFSDNNDEYGILINKLNINNIDINNEINKSIDLNKPLTIFLRNIELIKKTDFYYGPSLFINNCFLH